MGCEEKKNTCTLLMGMQTSAATVKNSMEEPQKIKTRITIGSSNPTPGGYPEELKALAFNSVSYRYYLQ